jgi:catechol 2,3-dioxygenase-like lactoylglutathione lyase family enzyme
MFKRIDHVEIVTDKPDETINFYTDILGFTVRERQHLPRPGTDTALNLVYLDLGGTTVELMTYEGVPVSPKPELEHFGYRLIAIEVEDMKEALAFLKDKGIEPVWGPMFRDTYARAEIADPNGYRIELRHWV